MFYAALLSYLIFHYVRPQIFWLKNLQFSNAWQIATYVQLFYISIKLNGNVFNLFKFVCLWENRGTKNIIFSKSLELVNVGGYDFPRPCDDPRNRHLFLSGPW
jgi:hypothetical protein